MIRLIKTHISIKALLCTFILLIILSGITLFSIIYFVPVKFLLDYDNELKFTATNLRKEITDKTIEETYNILNDYAFRYHIKINLLNEEKDEVAFFASDQIIENTEFMFEYDSVITDGRTSTDIINTEFMITIESKMYYIHMTKEVYEVQNFNQVLFQILPWILIAVFIYSVIMSCIYSWITTKPIIKMSRIVQNIAMFNFEENTQILREDEIGILASNIDLVSEKLRVTLDELRTSNNILAKNIDKEKKLHQKQLAFFSAVSHELKNPVAVIKGYLEGMINNVGKYKDRDKYLLKILETTNDLQKLVAEILEVSKLEISEEKIPMIRVDISLMIEEITMIYRDLLEDKEISLIITKNTKIHIMANYKLLKRALGNIINNAVIYTPKNEKIIITIKESTENIILTVKNTGVFIPEFEMDRMFEPFYRVEKSRNRETGGSGLGLYIVSVILKLHKAEYKIGNTTEGIEFTILLKKCNSI